MVQCEKWSSSSISISFSDVLGLCNSYDRGSLFADDAKLLRKNERKDDCEHLQKDLNKIHKLSKFWEMEFNLKKCNVL